MMDGGKPPVTERGGDLERVRRLYGTLRLVNRAVARARNAEDLFRDVCEAAVDHGKFLFAWVGRYDAPTDCLVPVAQYGDEGQYLDGLKIFATYGNGPASRGPAATAFRTGKNCICNDFLAQPDTQFWWDRARHRGIRSAAVFPIRERNAVSGVFVVYADRPGFFQNEEVMLLDEAAADIAFALDNFARDEERRRADEVARRYVAIFESADDAIFSKSIDGTVTGWNPAAERLFGYRAAEIIGRNVALLIPPDRMHEEAMILTRIGLGEPIIGFETIRVAKDGRAFPVAETISPIRGEDGRIVGASKIVRDITDRKRSAEALREANATLERRVLERTAELAVAKERAESADRLKSAFLATMSHELRTPLNSIIGFTGILLKQLPGPLNAEQSLQLGLVEASARHLLALINDVLDISKIEAGQLEIRAAPFDLDAALARTIATVAPLAQKKQIALRLDAPSLGPVCSDQRRVEQILLNLLNNAIKFTDEGSVTLVGRVAAEDGTVRLSVHDTGVGIRAEDLGKLFKPFRQIDSGSARQHEGTGLGLAICRRLADLLRAQIAVESEYGVGSVFHFVLPRAQAG